MNPITTGVIAGVIGGLSVLIIALIIPAKSCPECGKKLPKSRKPASFKHAALGGWICPHCGCEIDRRGNKIVK
jgi:transposase